MRILLDTHIMLWALVDSPRLPESARELIMDGANDIYFSAVNVWEVAIKRVLVRKEMPVSASQLMSFAREAGYTELPITSAHVAAVEKLPHHHADPFDRMLVAQAMAEPLRLLTHDSELSAYGDAVMFV